MFHRPSLFERELREWINLDTLFREAYILIKDIGMSYADVRTLTRSERLAFIRIHEELTQKIRDDLDA